MQIKSNRGSAMIVALLFGAILAIALGSYLRLSLNASRLANRSFFANSARNLADTGLERVLWSLNTLTNPTVPTSFSWVAGGFSDVAGGKGAVFSNIALSGGAMGEVRVWVQDPAVSDKRRCVVRSTITVNNEPPITNTVEAYIEPRSFFGGGMVSREGIDFNGDVSIDSWFSYGDDADPANDKAYNADAKAGTVTARANARIASPKMVAIETANVYGRVAIGTDDQSGLDYQKKNGVVSGTLGTKSGIDWTRVEHNFSSSFPDVTNVPATGSALPAPVAGVQTLTSTTYKVYALDVSSGTLVVPSGVIATIVVDTDFSISGPGNFIVKSGGQLKMFVGGNVVTSGGNGIQNGESAPNPPPSFTMLGTRTAAQAATSPPGLQTWSLKGGSFLSAAVFAPNANVTLWGSGQTYGSLVANYVDYRGTGDFHQDESLANKKDSGLWGLTKWREITTATELGSSTIATVLNF